MYQELCSELRLPLQYYISNNLQQWNNSLGLEIRKFAKTIGLFMSKLVWIFTEQFMHNMVHPFILTYMGIGHNP